MRNKKKENSKIIRNRTIFVLIVSLWLFGLDALIVDKIRDNEMIIDYSLGNKNQITGNVIGVITPPTTRDAAPYLVFFNAIIAICFSMSYINWESLHKKRGY